MLRTKYEWGKYTYTYIQTWIGTLHETSPIFHRERKDSRQVQKRKISYIALSLWRRVME